jgi:hypothetical protein
VAVAAETFLDLNTVTVEEVTGRLRAVEQRRRKKSTPTVDSQGRLLLTQEEWMAKWKISGASGDKGSSSGAGGSGGGGGTGVPVLHAGAGVETVAAPGRLLGQHMRRARPRRRTNAATVARRATGPRSAGPGCAMRPTWPKLKKRRSPC